MKFLLMLTLSASYLTLGPIIAVETARSVTAGSAEWNRTQAPDPLNVSVHYKSDTWGAQG